MSRSAVVTGAGRGIGRATAELLLDRGWQVTGIDRAWPHGQPEGALTADLADQRALGDAISSIARIDALVNNAAIMAPAALDQRGQTDELRRSLEVNLIAAANTTGAALPALERAGGAIIHVASVHALASRGGISGYAASKGGLMAFTRASAVELGPRGIRVNAVVPGAIDTQMLSDEPDRIQRQGALDRIAARTPLGRVGRPGEVAEAIAFLADRERSAFVTGAALAVDGGALARLSTE